MNRILISAAHKSSGKTTVSIGLCAALSSADQAVQSFKKGPDYIDPMWLGLASGRPCYNLDFYVSGNDEIIAEFDRRAKNSDIAIIEGNKGLFDGLALDGSNSNAALAKLLATPVVLVVDTRGITRGIAPLLKGYDDFDPDIEIAGVILNQVGGTRHETKLRSAVEYYTDIPVLGAISRHPDLAIDERHLGLIPSNEAEDANRFIQACQSAIHDAVDLEKLLNIPCPEFHFDPQQPTVKDNSSNGLRIGIARDQAFGFYYPGDIERFAELGVEIVPIDMINDNKLPEVDGLFIGGGFPEFHIAELEANSSMRTALHEAIENGLPVYAECGGMMYLSETITWGDKTGQMVGVIPGHTTMHERPVGRGYTRLQETGLHPWTRNAVESADFEFPAHEFHHSSLEITEKNPTYAYKVLRGTGITGENDGYVYKNLLASYVHQRNVAGNQWVSRFVDFVRDCKSPN